MTARLAAAVSGVLLLCAAIGSWFLHPAVTAVIVGLSVVVMSVWQIYRKRAGIDPLPSTMWTTYVWPITFGGLAVVALNGWIYRISADAGSDSGELQMVVGLITGVIGMASAYGYGRLQAQKAQLGEVVEVDLADDDSTEVDDEQWFFPQSK